MKNLVLIFILLGLISCKNNEKESVQYLPDAIALNNKATELSQKFEQDSALILYDQAIALDENYYMPHFNKVGIYIGMKSYSKALYESEMVIKKKPDLAEAWFLAGLLNEHLENDEKAMAYYKKSIQIFTERINDSGKENDINIDKLNRALSKKFMGDESYIEDFKELENDQNNKLLVDQFRDKTKEEIMASFVN